MHGPITEAGQLAKRRLTTDMRLPNYSDAASFVAEEMSRRPLTIFIAARPMAELAGVA